MAEDLYCLTRKPLDAGNKSVRVERRCVWLRQIYDVVRHALDNEIPLPEIADHNGRIE